MNTNIPERPVPVADSECGWPGSHGEWAGIYADHRFFVPGDEKAPNLVVGPGPLVLGPGQYGHGRSAAGRVASADGRGCPCEAAPASGPGVVGAPGPDVTPGGAV